MSKYQQDEETLHRLKTGDHRHWKHFFDSHLEAFQLFLAKYGSLQRDAALDLYQEAVVILHRNITGGKLEAPLRASLQTYLFGVGKNLCRRKGSNLLAFPADLPDLPLNPIEEEEERRHNAALVKGLLARIDEKCRQFLTLIFLEERPQAEIVAQLAIPTAEAFRKRKHDCLKKMRGAVDEF